MTDKLKEIEEVAEEAAAAKANLEKGYSKEIILEFQACEQVLSNTMDPQTTLWLCELVWEAHIYLIGWADEDRDALNWLKKLEAGPGGGE